jgi:hypothetical protein
MAIGVNGPTPPRLRQWSWTRLPGAILQLIGSTKSQARLEVREYSVCIASTSPKRDAYISIPLDGK